MERLDQLKNLVIVAVADGSMHEDELAMLSERCHELGMTATEFQEAVAFGLSRSATLALPDDPAEQEAMLEDMLRMMAVDGMLTDSEKKLFAIAATKMNFDLAHINRLIDRLVK